jgi:V8-like Glu-specific endopeptidase
VIEGGLVATQYGPYLVEVLASLYPTPDDSRRLVASAKIRTEFIRFNSAAIVNWHNILQEARNRGAVTRLVKEALKDYPDNPWLTSWVNGEPSEVPGLDIRTAVDWAGADAGVLEKITGERTTLLPILFLRRGVIASRAVGRIVTPRGSGTGFLFGALLITNHHVISSDAEAARSTVQFGYEAKANGQISGGRVHALTPAACFITSKEDDWTAVGVDGLLRGQRSGLIAAKGNPAVGDFVNIIQHPNGGPKSIALYHNTVASVGPGRLQYLTDTLPGSSGAPVFNSDWEVVAVHHSGGWLEDLSSTRRYFRNQGTLMSIIQTALSHQAR